MIGEDSYLRSSTSKATATTPVIALCAETSVSPLRSLTLTALRYAGGECVQRLGPGGRQLLEVERVAKMPFATRSITPLYDLHKAQSINGMCTEDVVPAFVKVSLCKRSASAWINVISKRWIDRQPFLNVHWQLHH